MDKTFVYSVINFSVFSGMGFYYLRGPVKNYVSGRHTFMRDEVAKVREQLRSSQEKYEEFSAKLKAVDVEVVTIRENSQKDAAALKARMTAMAKQVAGTVIVEARSRATSLATECREQLRAEVGLRIVTRAQELILNRMTGDDRARIRKEFSERVGSAS